MIYIKVVNMIKSNFISLCFILYEMLFLHDGTTGVNRIHIRHLNSHLKSYCHIMVNIFCAALFFSEAISSFND